MNHDFAAAMRRAADLTRAGNVATATRVIQDAIAGRTAPLQEDLPSTVMPSRMPQRPMLRLVQTDADAAEPSAEALSSTEPWRQADIFPSIGGIPSRRMRRPLGEVLRTLREGRLKIGAIPSVPAMSAAGLLRASEPPPVPKGAQFLTRSFTCAAGTRSYKLYVPASAPDQPQGLVVMLHGCKQDPDDFATGTNMNAVAEAHGLAVAYPAQPGSSNSASCWNWFNPADQMRDAGEPLIIAGITREIVSEFHIDRHQVFVAGLSAGGAMASVMAETYPDLYAAVGVHSGLGYRSASDVMSAFAAMRGETRRSANAKRHAETDLTVRTIVFHGSADQVVHPSNAQSIVDAASRHHSIAFCNTDHGSSADGRTYTRSVIAGPDGTPAVEFWLIDHAGHAWSGGRAGGSYTDPRGPDASAEIIRFFLD